VFIKGTQSHFFSARLTIQYIFFQRQVFQPDKFHCFRERRDIVEKFSDTLETWPLGCAQGVVSFEICEYAGLHEC
jgi:hypothetical protein